MSDGPSNYSSLREEWSLLVHSFLDQQPEEQNLNPNDLSLEQVGLLQKDLSHQRKVFNQKIEDIKNQIEDLNRIIENLILVGSDPTDIQKQLIDLNVQGEKVSVEIFKIESKIKKIHELKEKIFILTELDQTQ